jgi:hypothetical protein
MTQKTFLWFTLLFFLNSLNSVFAQDKIITVTGDTIDCNILRISNKKITYKQNAGGISATLQKERRFVKAWIKNEDVPLSGGLDSEKYEIEKPPFPRWRISANGGMGYRVASTRDTRQNLIAQGFPKKEVDSYLKAIKLGETASGQVHYMFSPAFGAGVNYQFFRSSGSMTGFADPQDGVTLLYGVVEDKEFTNYAGLSFYYHEWVKSNKAKFYGQLSLGLTMYREEAYYFYNPLLITGKAFGGNSELGFEYFVFRNTALGINFNYFQSTITKINVNNGHSTQEMELEKEEREGLSRVEINAGIKIYF